MSHKLALTVPLHWRARCSWELSGSNIEHRDGSETARQQSRIYVNRCSAGPTSRTTGSAEARLCREGRNGQDAAQAQQEQSHANYRAENSTDASSADGRADANRRNRNSRLAGPTAVAQTPHGAGFR